MKLPFDAIYILTCKKTKKRLPAVQEQLTELGLDSSIPVHIMYSPSSEFIKNTIQKYSMSGWNRRNPYGFWCTFGHYLIAHNALDREYKRILILEDDIRFIKDKKILEDGFLNIPNDFDFAMLDWWPHFYCDYWRSGEFIKYMIEHKNDIWVKWDIKCGFKVKSAGAYISTEKGLKTIIDIHDYNSRDDKSDDLLNSYRTADEIFDSDIAKRYGINGYIANPILARQVNIGGHGGGQDSLYMRGQITADGFSLDKYRW